jgi:hypothetical protein
MDEKNWEAGNTDGQDRYFRYSEQALHALPSRDSSWYWGPLVTSQSPVTSKTATRCLGRFDLLLKRQTESSPSHIQPKKSILTAGNRSLSSNRTRALLPALWFSPRATLSPARLASRSAR